MKERSYLKSKRPSVALIIPDAGIKSIAIAPLLEKLNKSSIDIDAIYCCGAGAIIASLYCLKTPLEKIISITSSLINEKAVCNRMNLSSLSTIIPNTPFKKCDPSDSIFNNHHILTLYNQYFSDLKVEDLPLPLNIQTTELESQNGHIITEGNLAEALYASNAFYPFLPPIHINNHWLVGGIYSNYLPILPAINSGEYDIIICVDFEKNSTLPDSTFFEYYINLVNRMMSVAQTNKHTLAFLINECSEFIFINIRLFMSISYWDQKRIPYILSRGRISCNEHIKEILNAYETIPE